MQDLLSATQAASLRDQRDTQNRVYVPWLHVPCSISLLLAGQPPQMTGRGTQGSRRSRRARRRRRAPDPPAACSGTAERQSQTPSREQGWGWTGRASCHRQQQRLRSNKKAARKWEETPRGTCVRVWKCARWSGRSGWRTVAVGQGDHAEADGSISPRSSSARRNAADAASGCRAGVTTC